VGVKYQRIAALLKRDIESGVFRAEERLPGELEMARSFDVSRSTIRQALSTLQSAGLIQTWGGAGSFVCYDGARLDDERGWSQALARHGVQAPPRILRFERINDPDLAGELVLPSPVFLALDRVRSTGVGNAISLERSRLPWRAAFTATLQQGLVEGSLRRTMDSLGIRLVGGSESIELVRLARDDAQELHQTEGEPFLATRRIAHDASGAIVEYLRSLLHPAHFTLRLNFGAPRR
jgi:GntR family transcriptional regulator